MVTVEDLFHIRYGQSLELNRLKKVPAPLGVNFVSRAMRQNGVTARVIPPGGILLGDPGELTVALSGSGVLSTFVQPEAFVCGFHVAILAPRNSDMPLWERFWWGQCIVANRYRYSYGRQANRSLAKLGLRQELPSYVSAETLHEIRDQMIRVLNAI